MSFLDSLSEVQRAAVVYNDGPHLIVAGAGSGKTRVLTYKIAYLISQGVSAGRILALTFTNKAAREMRNRIEQLVGSEQSRYLTMGTFHSIFSRVLRSEAQLLGYSSDYTIYDTTDSKSVIKQIIKEMDLDEKVYKQAEVLSRISEAKNNLLSPREYAADSTYDRRDKTSRMYRMADVYYYYQKRLREANAMDFDDLLCNMYYLLRDFPETRQKYQDIFQYILVDEYQDTNRVQYLIIRYLAEPRRHICVVGDDAQSIYGFRGADIRNILGFQSDYQGCQLFKLERNYRSTKNIVGAANSLIHHNLRQISKDVYSEKAEGLPIQISKHATDREEGVFLAEQARRLHYDGLSYDEMAILYRTNAQSRVIEDEFRKYNIPYRIYGGLSFYQRREIKDVIGYFRLVCNLKDDEALLRIVNFPSRKLGDTTMKKVKDLAHQTGVNLFDIVAHPDAHHLDASTATKKRLVEFAQLILGLREEVDKMDAYSFATEVLKRTAIRSFFLLDNTQEGQDRLQNVEELMSAIREYTDNAQSIPDEALASADEASSSSDPIQHSSFPIQPSPAEGQPSSASPALVTIRSFLSEVSLLTDQDLKANEVDTERVTLMTVHSAKGLEFDAVMIAGMEENLFPSMFSDTPSEIEEERRLFYVAITRAKEQCYITSADMRYRNGQQLFPSPSRFLREIDPQFVSVKGAASSQRSNSPWSKFGFGSDASFDATADARFSYGRSEGSSRSSYDRNEAFSSRSSYGRSTAPSTPVSSGKWRKVSSSESSRAASSDELSAGRKAIDCAFPPGARVMHHVFGLGTVVEAYHENGNDKIVVNFLTAGTKTMIIKFAKLTLVP